MRGKEIAERIGQSFGLLPVPGNAFWCKVHRSQLTEEETEKLALERYLAGLSEEARASTPKTMRPPPMLLFDCETRGFWPQDAPWDSTRDANFPEVVLPDGRLVICIPDDRDLRPSSVRTAHWESIVQAGKAARGELLRHAYEITLSQLQKWRKCGAETRKLFDERNVITQAGNPVFPNKYPFNVDIDWKLISWMSEWDDLLWGNPATKFTPAVEARAILHRILGIQPDTVKNWMVRSRRVALGIPAEGRRKPSPRTRGSQKKRKTAGRSQKKK